MAVPLRNPIPHDLLGFRTPPAHEFVPAGFAGLELPRGAITDIFGPASSGRTSLLLSTLALATAREEVCALVDATDSLDPESAAAAGVALEKLLWIRCGGHPGHALKAADLLVQAGGFGMVALDLGDVPADTARRIPLASWYRFRRAVENTPAVLVVVEREPSVKSCASLVVEAKQHEIEWSGAADCSRLLRALRVSAARRKPAAAPAPSATRLAALG